MVIEEAMYQTAGIGFMDIHLMVICHQMSGVIMSSSITALRVISSKLRYEVVG